MDLHKEHVRRTNNGVEDLFSARVMTIIDKLKSSQDSLFDQVHIQSTQTPVCNSCICPDNEVDENNVSYHTTN